MWVCWQSLDIGADFPKAAPGAQDQRWNLTERGMLKNMFSGMCMDVHGRLGRALDELTHVCLGLGEFVSVRAVRALRGGGHWAQQADVLTMHCDLGLLGQAAHARSPSFRPTGAAAPQLVIVRAASLARAARLDSRGM